jgi:deoxyribonuclease-4
MGSHNNIIEVAMDTLIRKKMLKIQDRLGMRIGIEYGTEAIPIANTTPKVIDVLNELYKLGLKAFILPKEYLSGIKTPSDLYKEHYGDLLKIKDLASKFNIQLAVQYPKLPDPPDDVLKTFCAISTIMGCRTFIIQPDFYSMMPQDQALRLAVYKINEIMTNLREDIKMGIETTGKTNQIGSIEDVIDIVKRTEKTEPIINWAHIHARGSGGLRGEQDYASVLTKMRQNIGPYVFQNAYFLFSGISYGPSGEIRHVPLENSDMSLAHLIKGIMSFNVKGTLIFEDPNKDRFILNNMERLGDLVR